MAIYIIGTDTSLPADQNRDVCITSRNGTVYLEGPFVDWAGFAILRDGIDDGLTVYESQAAGDALAHRIANGDTAAELAALGVDCSGWFEPLAEPMGGSGHPGDRDARRLQAQ